MNLRSIIVFVLAALAVLLAGGTAAGSWTTPATPAGGTAATADLGAPANVVAAATGADVTIDWDAAVLSTGGAPTGYAVTRARTAGDTTPVAVCAGTTTSAATICSDAGVAPGTYRYVVKALYNSWTSASAQSNTVVVAAVDATPPTATFTFPADAGSYALTAWNAGCSTAGTGDLCGTAGDAGGSGLDRVEVSIRKDGGTYWTGSAFASAIPVFNATSGSASSWSYGLTSGQLTNGSTYTIVARATDGAGNTGTATRTFTYDTSAPVPAFTFPAASAFYGVASWGSGCSPDPAGLCGTVSDASGLPVQAVEVAIRQGSGNYWNGSAFGSAAKVFQPVTALDATAGTWRYSLTLPAPPVAGQAYTVIVKARDRAQNESAEVSRTFTYETAAPPAPSYTFPANATTYNPATWRQGCSTPNADDLCGPASADTGPSGLKHVEVSVRQGSGNYWDGTDFASAGEVFNVAPVTSSAWNLLLPVGKLTHGATYALAIRSRDNAGNVSSPSVTRSFQYTCAATETLVATHDSWINSKAGETGNAAGGTSSDLIVMSKTDETRRVLVGFAMPALGTCTLNAATLRLYANQAQNSRTIDVHRATSAWTESVTWNTRPAQAGPLAGLLPSFANGTSPGDRSVAVTSLVQAMYATDQPHGFVLQDQQEGVNGGEQKFDHRGSSATRRPRLEVTFAP